jgi:hypothetical protein
MHHKLKRTLYIFTLTASIGLYAGTGFIRPDYNERVQEAISKSETEMSYDEIALTSGFDCKDGSFDLGAMLGQGNEAALGAKTPTEKFVSKFFPFAYDETTDTINFGMLAREVFGGVAMNSGLDAVFKTLAVSVARVRGNTAVSVNFFNSSAYSSCVKAAGGTSVDANAKAGVGNNQDTFGAGTGVDLSAPLKYLKCTDDYLSKVEYTGKTGHSGEEAQAKEDYLKAYRDVRHTFYLSLNQIFDFSLSYKNNECKVFDEKPEEDKTELLDSYLLQAYKKDLEVKKGLMFIDRLVNIQYKHSEEQRIKTQSGGEDGSTAKMESETRLRESRSVVGSMDIDYFALSEAETNKFNMDFFFYTMQPKKIENLINNKANSIVSQSEDFKSYFAEVLLHIFSMKKLDINALNSMKCINNNECEEIRISKCQYVAKKYFEGVDVKFFTGNILNNDMQYKIFSLCSDYDSYLELSTKLQSTTNLTSLEIEEAQEFKKILDEEIIPYIDALKPSNYTDNDGPVFDWAATEASPIEKQEYAYMYFRDKIFNNIMARLKFENNMFAQPNDNLQSFLTYSKDKLESTCSEMKNHEKMMKYFKAIVPNGSFDGIYYNKHLISEDSAYYDENTNSNFKPTFIGFNDTYSNSYVDINGTSGGCDTEPNYKLIAPIYLKKLSEAIYGENGTGGIVASEAEQEINKINIMPYLYRQANPLEILDAFFYYAYGTPIVAYEDNTDEYINNVSSIRELNLDLTSDISQDLYDERALKITSGQHYDFMEKTIGVEEFKLPNYLFMKPKPSAPEELMNQNNKKAANVIVPILQGLRTAFKMYASSSRKYYTGLYTTRVEKNIILSPFSPGSLETSEN